MLIKKNEMFKDLVKLSISEHTDRSLESPRPKSFYWFSNSSVAWSKVLEYEEVKIGARPHGCSFREVSLFKLKGFRLHERKE